jgi:RNA-binding protein 25
MSALAQQQQMHFMPPQSQKQTTLFVGSISGGITDAFLDQLLNACGPIKSFKRLITPANKPQGFGFAEFVEPDGALRAIALLNGVELPALEDGCANKKLLVRPIQSWLTPSRLLRASRSKQMKKRVRFWICTSPSE